MPFPTQIIADELPVTHYVGAVRPDLNRLNLSLAASARERVNRVNLSRPATLSRASTVSTCPAA